MDYADVRNQPVLIHCKRGKVSLLHSSWFSSVQHFASTMMLRQHLISLTLTRRVFSFSTGLAASSDA
jgi:hypothetical protein